MSVVGGTPTDAFLAEIAAYWTAADPDDPEETAVEDLTGDPCEEPVNWDDVDYWLRKVPDENGGEA